MRRMNRDGREYGFKGNISNDDVLQQDPNHARSGDHSTVSQAEFPEMTLFCLSYLVCDTFKVA